jgi:hypothetical protein
MGLASAAWFTAVEDLEASGEDAELAMTLGLGMDVEAVSLLA